MAKIKGILLLAGIIALFYTRLIGLSWGLPYPFHPDERNMAVSIQQMNLSMNPNFFAYGQFPLYLSYFGIHSYHWIINEPKAISFPEAVMALRLISSASSILSVFILLAIVKLLSKKIIDYWLIVISFLIFIFSPAMIQFSHFGTTESLLMLFYSAIVYLCLLFINKEISDYNMIIFSSLMIGLALSVKVSSVIFVLPVFVAVILITKGNLLARLFNLIKIGSLSLIFSVIFSPYNFIAFTDFLGSMKYESDVALGKYLPFYTRQFFQAVPYLFQIQKIFPYSLGWPVFILFLLAFIFLPWKRNFNFLRLSFLTYFLPSAYVYAKWTRFMAPVMPIMLLMATLFLLNVISKIKLRSWISVFAGMTATLILIIPGIASLSVYTVRDVRFVASDWIFKNIPANSYILSETANVVDLPIVDDKNSGNETIKNWSSNYISFDFYHLDENPSLQASLTNHLKNADYIFIPSRRVFYNHGDGYPILNKYYEDLFSGKSGFRKMAEFTSYPRIEIFGKKIIEFPDEAAEETWTVFDHPVFRIYKRI